MRIVFPVPYSVGRKKGLSLEVETQRRFEDMS
jgi:hypothetical protein